MAAAKKQARKPTSRRKGSKTPKSKVQKSRKPSKPSKQRKPPSATSVTISIVAPGIVSSGQENQQVANNTQFFFKNTSPLDVNLNFTTPFNSVSVPRGQTFGPISSALSIAISYTITDTTGNMTGGPYAIQWGNGVLEITIKSVTPNFDPVAVVPGSFIHYTAIDSDYAIKWQTQGGLPVTIWSPQPTVIYKTPTTNPVQRATAGAHGPFDYVLTAKDLAIGGGTVKVGS